MEPVISFSSRPGVRSRRRFLKQGLSAAGLALGGGTSLASQPRPAPAPMPAGFEERDKYGGCPGLSFEPSGFFRLEKRDRWWLVTPDGSAFLSWGVNHVAPHLLRQKENQDHWLRQFGASDPRDPAFLEGFRGKVRDDLEAFGFNTLGTHSSMRWYPAGFAPYVCQCRFLQISHWQEPTREDFLDVFSPSFEAHCERLARELAAPVAQDPSVIGYSFVDCPIFTEIDAAPRPNNVYGARRPGLPTWPRVLRNLAPKAAGKKAYVALMRERHADIAAFNRAYGSDFGSWEALSAALNWRLEADASNQREAMDNHAFLLRVIDQYYRTAVAAVRKFDSRHLILGDKLNGNTHTPNDILAVAERHTDLIFYQMFAFYPEQKAQLEQWAQAGSKAFFSGDSSYAVPGGNMPDPYGPHCRDQQERARRSLEFAEAAFARPDFVGWNHCGWMDGWASFPRQELKQHQGLQTPFGEYHHPMREAFSDFSRRMYQLAAG